jgi:nucleoside-diphosphate-sugar epimerase
MNNTYGTHVLLEACRMTPGIKRVINVSTDEVYGETSLGAASGAMEGQTDRRAGGPAAARPRVTAVQVAAKDLRPQWTVRVARNTGEKTPQSMPSTEIGRTGRQGACAACQQVVQMEPLVVAVSGKYQVCLIRVSRVSTRVPVPVTDL